MRISLFFSQSKFFRRQPVCPNVFEKNMAELMDKSKEAVQELSRESFNSDTLKTLCMPEFRPQHPNCLMAVSTKKPNQPVEVCYKKTQNDSLVSIEIYEKEGEETLLGKRDYILTSDESGKLIMKSGSMSSDEEACKKVGVKGIGMLERILQINDAIANGINSIPCYSYARSVLFHLKMGFMPVPNLKKVEYLYELDKIMENLIQDSHMDVFSKNYTPIIVLKDGKYYLDVNTTQCIANLSQIKQNYEAGRGTGVRPFIRGRGVDFVLDGENFDIWKRLLNKS